MAPHDPDPGKEAKRHAAPLIGLAAVVAAVAIGFIVWVWNVTGGPEETEATPVEEQPAEPEG